MNQEIKGSQYLSVKDFSTIGIFCAIMFIVFMAYSMITGASMFYSMIFNASGAAFILSPFFVYMSLKVGKKGPAFIYNAMFAVITGLMMGPFMIPWFLGGGILAEVAMIGRNSYKNMTRITIAWIITCLVRAAHGMAEIWFFKDAFINTGVSAEQVAVQTQYYTDPKYVMLSLIATVILAILGCAVSNKLIYKHFKKSGIIE